MRKWIIILVIAGLVGYAVYDFTKEDSSPSDVVETEVGEGGGSDEVGLKKGNTAPDFKLQTIDGEQVKLPDYRGEKVILNFWATWCPPCRAEMPDMQKFHADHDATILAVNLTETEQSQSQVEDFLEEYGVSFTVLSDVNTHVATLYNASALPTSYLINSKGEIHNIAIGALNYEMMVQAFDEME
ncbi:MAG TPA: redoxin domain-containing protein [Pseudogracilibacillus sp.]|nr:redoxin domain-containing protein [Pseudogracilibacillus sp.]